MRRRRQQRGAVAVLAAITIPTILIIAAGLILIGREATTRQRLQYATDAVATDGALMAKRQGLASPVAANVNGGVYPWLPSASDVQNTLGVAVGGNFKGIAAAPTLAWEMVGSGNNDWAYSKSAMQTSYAGINISALATVRVPQLRTLSPRRRPPGIILVLDYSNSMNKQGDGATAIQLLKSAATNFLQNLQIDYANVGLVIYGSNVYTTVDPEIYSASGGFANVLGQINANPASGDTDTADALQKGVDMLLALPENFGRNIILISDGEPCCGGDATARAISVGQAARDVNGADVQIRSIAVHHIGTTGNPDDTLTQIATPGLFYSTPATGIADTLALFNIEPLCDMTPPGDVNDTWAYLRNEGAQSEQSLQRFADSSSMACGPGVACNVYGYTMQSTPFPRAIFSSRACSDVYSGARSALIRWGRPILTR